jgi:magnesium chelatase family protein
MTSVWNSSALLGVKAHPVQVEADLMYQLPSFQVVGLPGVMVRESRDRVRSAIRNSGFDFPVRKVVVNLIPANLKKDRLALDLPMALSILEESGQIPRGTGRGVWALGELSLQGEVLESFGLLPALMAAKKSRADAFLIPSVSESFLAFCSEVIPDLPIYSFNSLRATVEFLRSSSKKRSYTICKSRSRPEATTVQSMNETRSDHFYQDMGHLVGLDEEKKILSVAMANRMHVLLSGPRGVGKSALVKALEGLQPKLEEDELIECASIRSLIEPSFDQAYKKKKEDIFSAKRPFRAPHCQSTVKSFFGGGRTIYPGEITLAHKGILFMDEISEFSRVIREGLRQPLEDRVMHVNRADYRIGLPADFQMMGTTNLCPCGALGSLGESCLCGEGQIKKYRSRLSESLLDRIQIHIRLGDTVHHPKEKKTQKSSKNSDWFFEQVSRTLTFQKERAPSFSSEIIAKHENYLSLVKNRFHLSQRALKNIAKLARALADFDESAEVKNSHMEEASYWSIHSLSKRFSASK